VGPHNYAIYNVFGICLKESPLVSLRVDHVLHEGNDRYEGFNVDLLSALAASLHFNYTIETVGWGQYGTSTGQDGGGQWTGMMGRLLSGVRHVCEHSLCNRYTYKQYSNYGRGGVGRGFPRHYLSSFLAL